MARWGMPFAHLRAAGQEDRSRRHQHPELQEPHWRRWLGPAHRCLVPFTSFSENDRDAEGKAVPVWFALSKDRPLAFFAGVWTPQWRSVRKLKEGEVAADLFGFLTTNANAEVGAVHPKAMPVILTEPGECADLALSPLGGRKGPATPLPDGSLTIAARGARQDGAPDASGA